MTVDELLNKLACDHPAGAEVAFYVENGAGWVEAHDWDGNAWEGGDNIELSIEQRALDALDGAKHKMRLTPQLSRALERRLEHRVRLTKG